MHLNTIFETAITSRASDIHLAVDIHPVIRVNGALLHVGEEILKPEDTRAYAMEILGEKIFPKFVERNEWDSSYSYQMDGVMHYFRVNTFCQRNNIGIVLRLIPSKLPTIESLQLPDVFKTLCIKRRGLILVTGPTGSGKSTTLAAMIEHMSKTRNEHIITIEDPIEYVFSHESGIVNQRQLGSDTHSFANAIRSALREDPDIIMLGEMRDLETISAALTAAETGHLVLATLHTIGAAKTIDRVIDVFPATQQNQIRVQLASVLEAVISQQLLPNRMNNGRKLALEIMVSNHAVANLIHEGKTGQIKNLMQMGSKEGMVLMDDSLISLYRKGQIDESALLKYCVDLNEMRRRISNMD